MQVILNSACWLRPLFACCCRPLFTRRSRLLATRLGGCSRVATTKQVALLHLHLALPTTEFQLDQLLVRLKALAKVGVGIIDYLRIDIRIYALGLRVPKELLRKETRTVVLRHLNIPLCLP